MGKISNSENALLGEVRDLIEQSRQQVAVTVNAGMSLLYWQVGKRVNYEVLKDQRAEYGKQIVAMLARQLVAEYGRSFSEKNLRRMMQFAAIFPDHEIVVSLIRQLSWTHILAVIPIEDPLRRDFYIEMCRMEKWTVRTLRERIQSMLFERTAISRKPEETIRREIEQLGGTGEITPDLVFRDPYFLDFLNLRDAYSEKDLESAIVAELQRFIIELGSDFAFLARQKRISIDNRDYFLDLLFFHRRLKALVAIDLKLGEFDAAYKGQMELYLAWLEKYESVEGENPPIGLILCAGKNPDHVELLQLHQRNIRVADYLTALPPKEVLLNGFHRAIAFARNRLDNSREHASEDNRNDNADS